MEDGCPTASDLADYRAAVAVKLVRQRPMPPCDDYALVGRPDGLFNRLSCCRIFYS